MFRTMKPGLWLLGLSALLAGCFGDGKQSTIRPATDSGRVIQDVYAMVTWIDLGILILVFGLFFWAIFKYRATKENENEVPKQVHGHAGLELAWTIIPALILIFIAVPTWQGIFRAEAPPAEGTLQIEAVGHQWWWEFRYDNDGVVTANEMVLPKGRTTVVHTNSVDVIHAIWVPRLAGKIDSMPDRKANLIWFTPEEEGLYYGQCAEYCGTSHANMRFRVRVVSPEEFDAWLAREKQPPAPASDDAKAGQQLFVTKTCIACHTIQGNPMAAGIAGPNLNNLKERTALAAALIENTPENLERWIRDPQGVKPGAKMGVLDAETGKYKPFDMTEQEAKQLVAYLLSDPGEAAMAEAPASESTAAAMTMGGGDAAAIIASKGCGACHTIPGIPNAVGALGPSLAGVASRPKIAAGLLDNTPDNLKQWLHNPKAVKPNTLMVTPPLSDSEIDTLVEFLGTLK